MSEPQTMIKGGPRTCLAQRFVLNEIKVAVAKILSKFKLVGTENTAQDAEKQQGVLQLRRSARET